MATILFWNINQKPLIEEIVWLCHDRDVDILVLAESNLLEVEVLLALNFGQRAMYLAPFNPSSRLVFFFRYPPESVSLVTDEGGVSIRRIAPSIGADFLLVAVHLSSKLRMTENDQKFQAARAAEAIQEAESRVGHTRTLVIGDFNMNPFEVGLVGADCFHAVMDRKIAQKQSRTVQGRDKLFFYNPMWGRMGDSSPGPSGTYFYRNSGYVSYFWNTFDQVLLRPALLDAFSQENLIVISEVGEKNLLTENGISKSSSDHLPIVLKLQLERMVVNE